MAKAFVPKVSLYDAVIVETPQSIYSNMLYEMEATANDYTEESPFHGVTLVRQYGSDVVMAYRTQAVMERMQEMPVYIHRYLDYKHMCWRNYAHIKRGYMTLQKQNEITQNWWKNLVDEPSFSERLEEVRAFVDLASLERCGFVHPIDMYQANALLATKPDKSWLIRHTTTPWSMPHVDVFSISYKHFGLIYHERWINIHGVGVVAWSHQRRPSSLKDMYPDPNEIDAFATVMDVLHGRAQQLGKDHLVPVQGGLLSS